ncbi:RES family NAD+ phosphorylase [Sphingomonas sp. IC4-52]|uniref:RES family NAD+ phosphorylase n=1 Tax=Sphingomonas sp. IC4-52 TaxID=2887202 RepID=UPI001D122B8E|nr:RES family NAD+ phosphorylase [Sphingomonas sp. IC4-52]MCC2981151.1 RES family NAD+ phosphorylase [Sphingomonas sp. IC4-52]
MAKPPLSPLQGRFWRMLGIRWQHRPYDSGSHLTGGRWNPPGTPALYLSADYNTAIQEMHQDLIRPGTLVAFDVTADAIADLTDADPSITACLWREIHMIHKQVPPSWAVASDLIARGADGAIVPSVQHRGGRNLVLWRWHAAGRAGEGAELTLLDPEALLGGS